MNRFLSLLLSCLVVAASGCSSSLMKSSGSALMAPVNALRPAKKEKRIAKILCLWEAAEGQGLDEKPTRGFAGQIIFFSHGSPTPVEVNGTVKIFEYADYSEDVVDPKPIHMFTFRESAWNVHQAEGTLGRTYNVFIPYVEKRTGHVNCALRVEFESADGRTVTSPYTEVALMPKTTHKSAAELQRNIVSTTSNRQSTTDQPALGNRQLSKPKLDSTTIKLPRNGR